MGGGCLYKCELAQQRRIKKKQLELTQKYIVSEPVGQRGNDNKSVDFVCFVLIFFSPQSIFFLYSTQLKGVNKITSHPKSLSKEAGTSFMREGNGRNYMEVQQTGPSFSYFVCACVLLWLLFSMLLDEAVKRFRERKANVIRMAKIVSSLSSFQRSSSAFVPPLSLSLSFYFIYTINCQSRDLPYELMEIFFFLSFFL